MGMFNDTRWAEFLAMGCSPRTAILIFAERGCVEDQPQCVEPKKNLVLCGQAAAGRGDTAVLRAQMRIAAPHLRFLAGLFLSCAYLRKKEGGRTEAGIASFGYALQALRITTETFVPPKPKAFTIAVGTACSRAALGT